MEIYDEIASFGGNSDAFYDIVLAFPRRLDQNTVRFDGIGDLDLGLTADDLVARGYVNQGNLYEGMDAECVRYAKDGDPRSVSVESGTGRVLAIANFGGNPELHTEVGDVRVGSTLAEVRAAFGAGYQIVSS